MTLTEGMTASTAALDQLIARGQRHRVAAVPVSEWAIRAWCAAIGDRNPNYLDGAGGITAPPPMLQSWVGPGLMAEHEAGASLHAEVRAAFAARGFPAVVATDYEQEYVGEVRPGDRLRELSHIENISALKHTRLGAGHFVTIAFEFARDLGAIVGRLRARTFYFMPGGQPPAAGTAPAAGAEAGSDDGSRALVVPVTTTLVVAGALASNDFEKVHHDRDVAQAQGFKDIILSIVTTTGLVSRAAFELLPAHAGLHTLSLRLGTPGYPGDVLKFRCVPVDGTRQFTITGETGHGQHVKATVVLK